MIYTAVEKYEAARPAAAAPCFSACADSGVGGARNVSSPCWIGCFYSAALGPDAGTPGGAVAGVPLQTLLDAWNRPFLPEAEGGCPALGDEIRRAPPRPSARKWRGFPGFD